jgi:hypothetical protein
VAVLNVQESAMNAIGHGEIDLKDGLFSVNPAVILNATQLSLPTDLSIDDWQNIGQDICRISNASAWWLGDWLIFGTDKYPDRYRRAIAETSLDYQTLRNYAWIARRFPRERRRSSLSFQHHVEVAALSEAEQDHWLDFAETFKWSRNELRRQIKASYEEDIQPDRFTAVSLHLQVPGDLMQRCRKTAVQHGTDLVEWIYSTLDKAAGKHSGDQG